MRLRWGLSERSPGGPRYRAPYGANNDIFQTRYLCLDDSFPTVTMKHAPLESVHIYFDTATYDEIERDVKVTILTFSLSYQN